MNLASIPGLLVFAVFSLLPMIGAEPAPQTAEECHQLGMALLLGKGEHPLEDALVWLDKAVKLAPANPSYLADYGGTCLQIADLRRSFRFAVKGRDAMEKSLALDPSQLDCRAGLMKFYGRAPWPLGDSDKALAQAGEIGRYSSPRGTKAYLELERIFERSGRRSDARAACRAALGIDPRNAQARAAVARLNAP